MRRWRGLGAADDRPPSGPEAGRNSARAAGLVSAPVPRHPASGALAKFPTSGVGAPELAVGWPAEGRRWAECLGAAL